MTYRVATHISVPSLKRTRDVLRSVKVRTRDDTALIQDLPQGANRLARAFPIDPTFDALSTFTLQYYFNLHATEAFVKDVVPLHYEDLSKTSTADVIVQNLRAYKASYAADSSDAPDRQTHVAMEPYEFFMRQVNPDKTFFFHDVYITNATGLPARVIFTGGEDKLFEVDYATVDGHLVINHAHYEETLFAPLRIGRVHFFADATYDQFAFPATAPDPRIPG